MDAVKFCLMEVYMKEPCDEFLQCPDAVSEQGEKDAPLSRMEKMRQSMQNLRRRLGNSILKEREELGVH